MKSLLWFGILSIFSSPLRAENFYSPLLCPLEETSLRIQNSSTEPQEFWFQNLGSLPFIESYVLVKPQSRLHLALKDYLPANASAVSVKTQNAALSFQAFCKSTQKTWPILSTHSPLEKAFTPQRKPAASN